MTGRQRYQWWLVPLLVVAGVLIWWVLAGGVGSGTDRATDPSAQSPSAQSPSAASSESGSPTVEPSGGTDPASGLPIVRLGDLSPEAAQILELIDRGGPFEEDEDGGTFENREEILPDEQVGYYREYTVPTPGSDDRGARRIVAGEGGELYWTDDHYRSFSRIAR